ncbi:hypothetical protein CB0940_00181 [Cercospora beticola]|nr:hypothetical protein CB0940_00181 [Cercospora beticola]PIB01496.1 hypothetical protein CB0940_00181 [Cercospora beticola]
MHRLQGTDMRRDSDPNVLGEMERNGIDATEVLSHSYPEHDEYHGSGCEYDTTFENEQGDTDMSPEDHLQAIRDLHYVQVEEENSPEDYTDGPARLVLATDGLKNCPSLLLTFDLGLKIIRASELQRRYSREARHTDSQIRKIKQFEMKLKREIQSHRTRISMAEAQEEKAQEQDSINPTKSSLQTELHVLEGMLQGAGIRKQELTVGLTFRGTLLREAQAEVTAYLDEAFVAGNLLATDTEEELPVEDFDLQEEYQKAYQEEFGDADSTDGVEVQPLLDTSRDYLHVDVVPPTAEEQAEIDIRAALQETSERLAAAEEAFDFKDYERTQDRQIVEVAWQTGQPTEDANREDFDLRWYQRFQAITREFIEAEEAYREARNAALEAGLDQDTLSNHQEEYFNDLASDGMCDSEAGHDGTFWEHFASNCKQDKKVIGWLDSLPDHFDGHDSAPSEPDSVPDQLEEVEAWESGSAIAGRPLERKLIDRRQMEIDWQHRIRGLWDRQTIGWWARIRAVVDALAS